LSLAKGERVFPEPKGFLLPTKKKIGKKRKRKKEKGF